MGKGNEMQYVIVVDHPVLAREVIGPFPSFEVAHGWEDKHLDAPEGSRAEFVPLVAPSEFLVRGKNVTRSE